MRKNLEIFLIQSMLTDLIPCSQTDWQLDFLMSLFCATARFTLGAALRLTMASAVPPGMQEILGKLLLDCDFV